MAGVRWLLVGLALVLATGLPAYATTPYLEGRWKVTEFDPFFPENPFFGQYRYDLLINREESGVFLESPRSGMRLTAPDLKDGRLVAAGEDPSRGPIQLDIVFDGDRFEGRIRAGGREKRIVGTLSAEQRLERIASGAVGTEQQLAEAKQSAASLRGERDELAARVTALEDALAASRASQRVAEHQLTLAQQELAGLKATTTPPSATVVPLPVPAPRSQADDGPAPTSIEIIEPPLKPGADRAVAYDLPVTELVGRAHGGMRLLSVRVNGVPARLEGRGLFRASVTVAAPATPVRVVTIDVDGRRQERRFELVSAAGSGDDADPRGSAEARCKRFAVDAEGTTEAGIEACRQAVRANPSRALNHYHLGVGLSRAGRHAEALAAYQEAAARWSR